MSNLSIEALEALVFRVFCTTGVHPFHARQLSQVYRDASLRGVGHHDIHDLSTRVKWVRERGVRANPLLSLNWSRGSVEAWNGHNSLGESCTLSVVKRAMALARIHGTATVSVNHSNHFLAAGPYLRLAAKKGFAILLLSSTDRTMALGEHRPSVIGNNPMGFAMATDGETEPLVLDLCMAPRSLGEIAAMGRRGEALRGTEGYDGHGNRAQKPEHILQGGTIASMAGHKGFVLALMVEALTGVVNGGHVGPEIPLGDGVGGHSQTAIVWDIGSRIDAVSERYASLIGAIRNLDPHAYIPGSSWKTKVEEARSKGIEVRSETIEELSGL